MPYICLYSVGAGDNGDLDFRVGTNTVDASDSANALASAYTHTTTLEVDTTAPTVTAAYYSDSAASKSLSGTVKGGRYIYTKVTFSEDMAHVAASDATARPALGYSKAGGTATPFAIVANSATLANGQCQPDAAPPADVYLCRYRVLGTDTGDFDLEVGTASADRAGNTLASAWSPSASLTLEPAPVFAEGVSIADQTYAQGVPITTLNLPRATGGDTGTTLTYTLTPTEPAGLTFSASARTLTGTPSARSAEATYTYTVTETDGDSSSLTFKIEVTEKKVVAAATLAVAEGGSANLSVSLGGAPNNSVTVTIASDNSDVTVDTDSVQTGNQNTLTFTTGNWGTAQTVVVSAAQDADGASETATLTLDPSGADYTTVANATVTVSVTDDDTDSTAPTVDAAKSGYFDDDSFTDALSGTVMRGADIYARVTFSEPVKHVAGTGSAARPALSYRLSGTVTQYKIVGPAATLANGDCKPAAATPASAYLCYYTVGSTDSGTFDFEVGTATQDASDAGVALAARYTHLTQLTIDATPPTVDSANSGYFDDVSADADDALSGPVKAGAVVYTRIVFSENVRHKAGTGSSGRPALSHGIAGVATRYAIVADTATLKDGECQPDSAAPDDTYICRYTVVSGDNGAFDFRVGTDSEDGAGNALASAYTHTAKLALDNTPPTLDSATVNGSTLTATFSENMDTSSGARAAASAWDVQVAGSARTVSSYTLSGNAATLTLASAADARETVTLAYNQPTGTDAKLADPAGNLLASTASGSELSVTNSTADTTLPTVTFSPANGAVTNANSGNITLTFSEAVYKDASQGEFGASDLGTLIELKVTDDNGSAITFAATINDANTVVTVNPDANLADGDVYVEVGSGFYDVAGNQGASVNATFAVDATAPTVLSATVSGSALTVTFSENMDTSAGARADKSAFAVTVAGSSRGVSSYTLSGKTATLTLASAVSAGQAVTVAYTKPTGNNAKPLKDLAGNELASFSRTLDTTAATVTFSPANGARTNANAGNITLTFSEAVYKDASGTEFGATDLGSLIELKVTDDNGSAIGFAATINDANTVVTVNPDANLADGDVYVEVGSGFYDGTGNQGTSVNATFTVDTAAPTVSSASVTGKTLTVTFSEAMKTSPLPAASAFAVDVNTGTDPTATAISVTGSTATLTLSSAVTSTQTVTLTYTKPGANPLQDLAGNDLANITSGSPQSVTNTPDTTPPSVVAAQSGYYADEALTTKLTGPVKVGADIYSKIVFNEDIVHVAVSGVDARPFLSGSRRKADGTTSAVAAWFNMQSSAATLQHLHCKATSATSTSSFVCRYKTQPFGGDDYAYYFQVLAKGATDLAGNQQGTGHTHAATAQVDATAPTLSSAMVNGAKLTVTFSENMDVSAAARAAASAFKVTVGGNERTVRSYTLARATATLTLASAVGASDTVKVRYVKPGGSAAKLRDVVGHELETLSAANALTATNNTGKPTVSFKLGAATVTDSLVTKDSGSNLTLTFDKAVYKDASQSTFGAADLESLIELKENNDSGDAIDFSASINAANTVVTVNPSNNLPDGDVYLEVGNGFYDAGGAQGVETTVTFTVDTAPPTLDSAAVKGTALTLNFSEALRKSPLPAATAFTLAVDTGTAPAASSISVSGSTASVVLATPVTASQTVTLTYAKPGTNPLQDLAGNDLAAIPSASKVSVTNNTDDTAPTVTAASSGYYANAGLSTPLTGRVTAGTDIYVKIAFSENVGHTAGTGASARPAIGYKIGSAAEQSFAIVGHTATLATGQCQPDAAHPADVYECRYTVASGDTGDFDFRVGTVTADTAPTPNRLAAKYTHKTKLVVDTTAPTLSAAAVSGATLTVTFSENMDTSSSAKAAASAWDVQVAGSARTVSSYTLSGKTATLTLASAATATQTVTVAYDQPSGTNAKLADLAGNLLATTATGSEVTATNNTGKPTVGFKLGTAALTNKLLSNDADGNIVLTFSEAVYANSSQTAFTDSSVKNIITLKTTGPTGTNISYGATVTTTGTDANKVVTINPDSNLADGVVYVAVSNAYYDSGGNQGFAAIRSFTIDTAAPTWLAGSFDRDDRDKVIVTFSENLRPPRRRPPPARSQCMSRGVATLISK